MIHLNPAVADSLASFWCPTNRASFLATLFALVAAICIVGIVLRRFGRVARIAGLVLILFAIGGGAMELFGLSGCGPHFAAGVTWDRPW